jgi:uroporphyrinogen-III decarboxylase
VDRIPLAFLVDAPPSWERFRIDEAFRVPDLMLINELRPIYASALVGDDRTHTVRANFGVGILPSLFGCEIKLTYDAMPWVESLNDREAIRRIVKAGPPDTRGGLWPRVEECQQYFVARIGEYSNLSKCVSLSMCDMQGPFSIAHLVWGNDIYYAVVDEPALVTAFLEVVTDTYIRFIAQERVTAGADEDFTEFLNVLVPGKVLIREDSATNLSPHMYETFCLPYIQRTLDVLPGGIHYCGKGHQFFDLVRACRNLTSMNFGNPELQDVARIRDLIDARIAVVSWNGWPLARDLENVKTGLSIGVSVGTVDEAKLIWAEHLRRA